MELGFDPKVSAQGQTQRQKLQDLSQKFEAVFMSQAFSAMRDTVPKDGLVDTGTAGEVFNSMFDRQMASMGAQRGGLGVSQALYSYLEQGLPEGQASGARGDSGKLDTRG